MDTIIKRPIFRLFSDKTDRYISELVLWALSKYGELPQYLLSTIERMQGFSGNIIDNIPGEKDPNCEYVKVSEFKDRCKSIASEITERHISRGERLFNELNFDCEFLTLLDNSKCFNDEFKYKFIDEIEFCLCENDKGAMVYIKDVLRWIIRTIDQIGIDEYRYFLGIENPCTIHNDMVVKLQSDAYLNDNYDDPNLELLFSLIECCWWFFETFEQKCSDCGYDLKQILQDTNMPTPYSFEESALVQSPTKSQPTLDPIDEIIIHQDTDRAKLIIKEVMRGMKNKEACVALRALIKAKVIKSDSNISRSKLIKIISGFVGFDIGNNNSIGRYWLSVDDKAQEKCNIILTQFE